MRKPVPRCETCCSKIARFNRVVVSRQFRCAKTVVDTQRLARRLRRHQSPVRRSPRRPRGAAESAGGDKHPNRFARGRGSWQDGQVLPDLSFGWGCTHCPGPNDMAPKLSTRRFGHFCRGRVSAFCPKGQSSDGPYLGVCGCGLIWSYRASGAVHDRFTLPLKQGVDIDGAAGCSEGDAAKGRT